MNKHLYKYLLRINYEIKKYFRRPFSKYLNPFQNNYNFTLIHCCYHKIGTVWFGRILREIAAHYGMIYGAGNTYQNIIDFETKNNFDIFLDLGSHVNLDLISNYRGSHMIRDPRDMIVSAYHYHLWTNETWANIPLAEHRGMTYKEYLNSLDFNEGFSTEMKRSEFWVNHMADWNYQNPHILEIRYEDIINNESEYFHNLFKHYCFNEKAIDIACKIAEKYSFENMAGKKTQFSTMNKSHLRSGGTGEWEETFNSSHKDLFKKLYPGIVSKLGYEDNENW